MAMTDTKEMAEERENYVALDVVRCACGRVYLVRRGEENTCAFCIKNSHPVTFRDISLDSA